MAVLGRLLVSSAERLDLPDLLSLDSYAAGDWKYFLKGLVGDSKPFILKGFDVIDPGNAIGTQSCSIRVADSVTFYPGSNSGSFFHGLQEGHPQAAPLVPELRKNAVNYVYLTFSTFNTSVDTRAFWDPDKDGGVGGEFTQDVNTESVLQVQINVSTGSFPANTVPVAKITVGPVVITAIEDARDMMFRLGSGGINPNPFNTYGWRSLPGSPYQRSEPPTQMLAGGVNPFQGADKNILTLKEWMDAVMSKLRELGGTTYWYDDTSSFGIVTNFFDAVATTFKSKGQWMHDTTTPGLLTWTEDVQIKMTSDPRTYIIRQGSKTLANEQVMYIPMIRNQAFNVTDENVSWTNGQAYINTIGGAVGLFANLAKGDYVKKANDSFDKFLRVEEFYDAVNLGGSTTTAAGARSVRLSGNYLGVTGAEKGRYDKGAYLASDVVVSSRDAAAIANTGGNFHWLAMRSDTIENTSNIVSHTLALAISEHDGSTAKVTSAAHGLVDGDRITITGTTNFNGTYQVEVETANIFYINKSGGPFANESGSGFYATVTTSARSTPYGFQEESANHGFASNDTITIASTTNYNGNYKINVIDATTFTIARSAAFATETSGTATLARVLVRIEGGGIDLIQGQIQDISGSVADNIRQYLGMGSLSETAPNYSIPPTYNTLDGMQNYNGVVNESITPRVSKLTAMMADKAQDKMIRALPSNGITSINNTTNGAAQELTFTPAGGSLTFITPGSDGQCFVALPSVAPGISLLVNQIAYVSIDRNNPTTGTIVVSNIATAPIDENTFVIAVRLATTDVYTWDGSIIVTGGTPGPGYLNTIVKQNQALKLIAGGIWSWNGTNLTWTAAAAIQIPGLANSVNNIAAGTIALTSGQVAYVDINRVGPGGSLTVTAALNSTLTMNNDRFIIAREDGGDVIVGAHSMRLISGESKKLYGGISVQNTTFIGAASAADAAPQYTSNNIVVDSTSLVTAISALDAAAGSAATAANQDRMTKLIKGGTWSWVSGTGTLTWTASAYMQIAGLADVRNEIVAGNVVLNADGQCAYVAVNRTAGAPATLTVVVAAIAAVPVTADISIIARRVGTDVLVGNHSMLLMDGESKPLYAGQSDQAVSFTGQDNRADATPDYATAVPHTVRYIGENTPLETATSQLDNQVDKLFGQLRIRQNTVANQSVILTGVDTSVLDGTNLAQQLKSLLLNFTGGTINFQTGTPSVGSSFTAGSTIALNQYRWYSVTLLPSTVGSDNRITGQILCIPAASDGASAVLAPRAAFGSSGIKIGQVVVHNSGVAGVISPVLQSDIYQLGSGSGGGGDGTGDANELLERLKDRLLEAPFDWVNANIFSTDADTKISSATATYDIANTLYKFVNIGDQITSIQSLDVEFLTEEKDIDSVELNAFWNPGFIDSNATYQVSRNGGVDWQTLTMERIGTTTETFRGILKFPVDTTFINLHEWPVANATAYRELNTTSLQGIGQRFDIPASIEQALQRTVLYINKVGSPVGNTLVSLVRNQGGLPGPSSALAQNTTSNGVPASGVSIGLIDANTRSGQSWTATATGSVSSITTRLASIVGAPSGNITMRIYADNGGPGIGTLLGTSNNFALSSLTGSYQDCTFTFSTPVPVVNGTLYNYIYEVAGTNLLVGTNVVAADRANTNVYAGGTYFSTDSTFTTYSPSSFDMYFIVSSSVAGSLDIISQTLVSNASLASGDNAITVSLGTNVMKTGTYHFVLTTDLAYKNGFSAGVNSVRARVDAVAPIGPFGISEQGVAGWTANAAQTLIHRIEGRPEDLRVRIISSASNVQLKGYGVFYDRQTPILAGIKNREVQQFNGTTNNFNTFTLTNFIPEADLLKVYHVETGQVYTYGTGGFSLNGLQVVFAANTFNGLDTVTLVFDQLAGSSFDNSDLNASLLAANFLGSTDATIDRSQNGRGIFLRRPDGTLREITIDNSDNIVVYSV